LFFVREKGKIRTKIWVKYPEMMRGNEKKSALTALILAGGKSSRVGANQNKAHLRLNGRPLIDIVIEKVNQVVDNQIIIVGPPEEYPSYRQVVSDLFSQRGPLGGIFSGLKASPSFYNLVVGCDMPFLKVDLLRYMVQNIDKYDVIIPYYGEGLIEPLCAIYSKRCLKVMEKNLDHKLFSIRRIFPFLKVRYMVEKEIRKYDPELYSFFNINYPEDLKRAEGILKEEKIENN